MSNFLTIRNSQTKKEIFEMPVTQSGKTNTRGSWLSSTLEKNSNDGVVITNQIKYTPIISCVEDCNWIINLLKEKAERIEFFIS